MPNQQIIQGVVNIVKAFLYCMIKSNGVRDLEHMIFFNAYILEFFIQVAHVSPILT